MDWGRRLSHAWARPQRNRLARLFIAERDRIFPADGEIAL